MEGAVGLQRVFFQEVDVRRCLRSSEAELPSREGSTRRRRQGARGTEFLYGEEQSEERGL